MTSSAHLTAGELPGTETLGVIRTFMLKNAHWRQMYEMWRSHDSHVRFVRVTWPEVWIGVKVPWKGCQYRSITSRISGSRFLAGKIWHRKEPVMNMVNGLRPFEHQLDNYFQLRFSLPLYHKTQCFRNQTQKLGRSPSPSTPKKLLSPKSLSHNNGTIFVL